VEQPAEMKENKAGRKRKRKSSGDGGEEKSTRQDLEEKNAGKKRKGKSSAAEDKMTQQAQTSKQVEKRGGARSGLRSKN
jgi:hypothetical protein